MGTARHHGILPDIRLKELIQKRAIFADIPITDSQIQPASLDLRLGEKAFRLKSSFLPELADSFSSQGDLLDVLRQELVMYEFDLSRGAILEKGHVYLVPLLEKLKLPKGVRGRTNPKSSTGRLDIFTRAITIPNIGFDDIKNGYSGLIYLEIVPISFPIKVKTGMSLNQLRLIKGRANLSDKDLKTLHEKFSLLYDFDPAEEDWKPVKNIQSRINHGLFLSVDLQGTDENPEPIIGYKAKKITDVLDLSSIGEHRVKEFWEPLTQNSSNGSKSLILEREEFYILASKEKIRIPSGYAAEMVAYEAACGELRTHYAGFFDPGFGFGNGDIKGTQAVLEVRPHDVPFFVCHGQKFFKVKYERLSEKSEKSYGLSSGASYHQQGLTLSKHFKQ